MYTEYCMATLHNSPSLSCSLSRAVVVVVVVVVVEAVVVVPAAAIVLH
jgi:hypothetical protein